MQTITQLPANNSLSPLDACEYLQSLHALARQLDRAMDAMVAGELSAFEDSVQSQRATCTRLMELAARSATRQVQPCDSTPASLDPDLAIRIDQAARSLHTLNQRYSALLKHSGETIRLLAGLFRSYSGPTQLPAIQADLRTWSCEG